MHRMTDWGAANLTQTHRRGGKHKRRQRHIHLHEILSHLLINVTRGPLGSWKCDDWQSLCLQVSAFSLRWEDKKDKAGRLENLKEKLKMLKAMKMLALYWNDRLLCVNWLSSGPKNQQFLLAAWCDEQSLKFGSCYIKAMWMHLSKPKLYNSETIISDLLESLKRLQSFNSSPRESQNTIASMGLNQ